MSVINKMLRDLDQGHMATPVPATPRTLPTDLAKGIVIVNARAQSIRSRVLPRWGVVMAVALLVAGIAAIFLYPAQTTIPVTATAPMAPTEPLVSMAAPRKIEPELTARPQLSVMPVKEAPVVAPKSPTVVKMVKVMDPLPPPVTSPPVVAPTVATPPVSTSSNMTLRLTDALKNETHALTPSGIQPAPARAPTVEVLAQAQRLWTSGSRDAALDLVREALVTLERTKSVAADASRHTLLASLARELARMEIAEGRVAQALSMLTRLEPDLSGFSDVWAIRGNAAQRLGRHEESVTAYQIALKQRPNEPRWMLAAAVSMAAQGQTAAAKDMAEKARDGGVWSPEIAAYLNQLGVILQERGAGK